MPRQPNILIFDSGVGGLTIGRELLQKRQNCQLFFAADNAAFPYGVKSDEFLAERLLSQMEQLIPQTNADIVVIACNTASTLVLDALRKRFDAIFVGVVPAIKPAVAISKTGTIALLATPATIKRSYTQQLIQKHAPNSQVILFGSHTLVEIAETWLSENKLNDQALNYEVHNLLSHPNAEHIDTAVLACTHFPLLKKAFHEALSSSLKREVNLVDSGEAIARRVESLLIRDQNIEAAIPETKAQPSQNEGEVTLIFSAPIEGKWINRYKDYLRRPL
ncbi:MAG: glutamate racemase [Alteromonadaceae bacterium]|nr:MAG: glutamate racemase [Alteromonadaceae bacterium]